MKASAPIDASNVSSTLAPATVGSGLPTVATMRCADTDEGTAPQTNAPATIHAARITTSRLEA
jgi:hypothetical protein